MRVVQALIAADKAGVKRGDRMLTMDGRWTDSLADLYEAAGYVKPGAKVTVKVKRGLFWKYLYIYGIKESRDVPYI